MGLLSSLRNDGITAVLVTHEADVARWARRVLVMKDGLVVRSTRGEYFPSLGIQLGGTLASRERPTIVPNLSGQLTLGWPLYEGGVTRAREREGEATLRQLRAQRDELTLSSARAALIAALGRT